MAVRWNRISICLNISRFYRIPRRFKEPKEVEKISYPMTKIIHDEQPVVFVNKIFGGRKMLNLVSTNRCLVLWNEYDILFEAKIKSVFWRPKDCIPEFENQFTRNCILNLDPMSLFTSINSNDIYPKINKKDEELLEIIKKTNNFLGRVISCPEREGHCRVLLFNENDLQSFSEGLYLNRKIVQTKREI